MLTTYFELFYNVPDDSGGGGDTGTASAADVWNYPLASATMSGSMGTLLVAFSTMIEPDPNNPGSWRFTPAALSDNLLGPGSDPVTLHFQDQNSGPIADADVWITADAPGNNVIAGTLQTDSNGNRLFMLDDGAYYYRWMQKDGYNSINGQLFRAQKDT